MRKPYSVGYFSSYDRGLECLLNMWPKIREQVPEATLDIYYGWTMFDAMHAKNPAQMKWKWQMIKKLYELKDQGVTEHGRLNHEELAKAMKEIQVLAYPTEFTEIHMITMLKAQESCLHCVHTGVGAISETGKHGTIVRCDDIYSNTGKQQEFIDAVVAALQNPRPTKQVNNVYWNQVAEVWNDALIA